ncbi:MAG: MFS transporter [Salinarimonas sp.]
MGLDTKRDYINIGILAVCHALYMSTSILSVAIASIASQNLLADATYATLPQAMIPLIAMISTIPAAMLMRRIGRKNGFLVGAVAGMASGVICSIALINADFILFLVGVSLLGAYQAFAVFYRFAVADSADARMKGKAISLVLAGGVLAAVIGPGMASFARDLFSPILFLGSYVATVAINFLALVLLLFLRLPEGPVPTTRIDWSKVGEALGNPRYVTAVGFCGLGTGVMMFVMTATPLAMLDCGFSVVASSAVISWHVLAMFVPSFFTGNLIERFGLYSIMFTGLVLMAGSAIVAALGITFPHFAVSLVINGLAWNFMFVGGSTLLASIGDQDSRPMLQGLNEFLTFGITAVATFASGAVFSLIGWTAIQIFCIFAIVALLLFMLVNRNNVFPDYA